MFVGYRAVDELFQIGFIVELLGCNSLQGSFSSPKFEPLINAGSHRNYSGTIRAVAGYRNDPQAARMEQG
jgi:hypothetical protein